MSQRTTFSNQISTEMIFLESHRDYFLTSIFNKVLIMLKSKHLNILLHICETYNCDYLKNITFRFYLIDFQLNTDFPFQILCFDIKSPSVTQR